MHLEISYTIIGIVWGFLTSRLHIKRSNKIISFLVSGCLWIISFPLSFIAPKLYAKCFLIGVIDKNVENMAKRNNTKRKV